MKFHHRQRSAASQASKKYVEAYAAWNETDLRDLSRQDK
jgi:hypothetical protein